MSDAATHILLVWPDHYDGALFAQTLAMVCTAPAYAVTHVRSVGEAAVELARATYHVVITSQDVAADNDGIALCRAVRSSSAAGRAAPAVIVGWLDVGRRSYAEGARRCAAAGAGGCFGRVFDLDGIKQMVDALVREPDRRGLHDQPVAYLLAAS